MRVVPSSVKRRNRRGLDSIASAGPILEMASRAGPFELNAEPCAAAAAATSPPANRQGPAVGRAIGLARAVAGRSLAGSARQGEAPGERALQPPFGRQAGEPAGLPSTSAIEK
jgi:hypothetical protein